ncbi:uncharacterized protein LOC114643912 [Erpetoichthys calabaricus]|uniref:uncharacterized protein LOC114643912 n=1 Tax=Erpetoichthys calabaricus TaxID=27687 RepID=UPI002234AA95|nr:uncharacterized protein LOC114643912 [Erpetoichthys calabaricus]
MFTVQLLFLSFSATRPIVPPEIFLYAPACNEMPQLNKTTLACMVLNSQKGAVIKWNSGSHTSFSETRIEATSTFGSHIEILQKDWLKNKYSCSVSHASLKKSVTKEISFCSVCYSQEPTIMVKGPIRSESAKSNDKHFKCIINGTYTGNVFWKFGGKEISSQKNETTVNGIVSHLMLSASEWETAKEINCSITDICLSGKYSSTGIEASLTIRDPSVTLTVKPNQTQTVLQCKASGFKTKDIKFKRLKDSDSKEYGEKTNQPQIEEEDGLFSQTVEFHNVNTEWNKGVFLLCEANKIKSSKISKCTDDTRQKVKQVVYLDGPNFEEPPNKLTATCSVVGPNLDGVVISWTVGSADRTPLKTVNPIDNGNGTQTVWSKLDISEDWKQGNEIVCHVSDACSLKETKKMKKVSNINEPILKIMRPPEYDLTEGKADLICIITNFFPSDISVKWIKNQTDVSNTQFVNDCPVQNGSVFSMVSRLKINEEDLKTAASFTCMVNHYYSNEWKRVDSPSNLFASFKNVEPKIILVASKSEGTSEERRLLCMVSEFSPKDMTIKWYKDDQTEDKGVTTFKQTMSQDGLFNQISQLIVKDTEWKMGHEYRCEAKGKLGKPVSKSISKCTDLRNSSLNTVVHLVRPSIEDDFHNKSLNATCMIYGPDLGGITVTWKVNKIVKMGKTKTSDTFENGTEVTTSILEKIEDAWKKFETIICEVKLPCNEKQIHEVSKVKVPKKPKITIFEPSEAELSRSSHVNLVCLINSFYPPDIFVQWKWNNSLISSSNYSNSEVTAVENMDGSVTYSMYSKLQVEKTHWGVGSCSCIVGHESENQLISETITNVFEPIIPTRPRAVIFQSETELICLVYGFSPKDIQVKWSLKKGDSLNYTTEHPSKGKDGKFTTNSRIQFSENEWLPGMVYTCSVVHNSTNTNLSVNISKQEIVKEEYFYDESTIYIVPEDDLQGIWNTACTFIILFLVSFLYSAFLTVIKISK